MEEGKSNFFFFGIPFPFTNNNKKEKRKWPVISSLHPTLSELLEDWVDRLVDHALQTPGALRQFSG